MKIVCLKGGLGNQMFEYCRFRDLMESGHDEVYLFYDHRRLKQHNGLRLSDCFELELPSCPWGVKLVVWGLKICRAVGGAETICILPTRVSVYVEWTISSKPLLMSERSGPMRVSFSFPTIWNG